VEDEKKETEGTPTVEEQLATIQKEKADLEIQLEEKSKGLKTAHAKLTQKDDELKRRSELEGRLTSMEESNKFLIGYLSETQGKTGDDFEEAKAKRSPDLLKRFQTIQAESEKKRTVEIQRQENISKINSIKERVEALGIPEDSEDYWEIEDFATRGKYDRAEARIKKLEAAKTPEPPKETEEQIKERLEREILEKHGLLKPEGAKPSAASLSFKKTEKEYSEGNITYAEYAKARQAAGL